MWYIFRDDVRFLPTVSIRYKTLINGNSNSELLITDYFETFIEALSSLRLTFQV